MCYSYNVEIVTITTKYKDDTTMNIYLLRHGQTDKNKAGILQGTIDTVLNEEGKKQALSAKADIENICFKTVYSSPLKRAFETAVLATGLSENRIVVDERLKEMSFGDMEGKVIEDKDSNMAKFFNSPEEYVAEKGAESFESMLVRAKNFLDEITSEYSDNDNVLIVSHGAFIHGLIMVMKDTRLCDFWKSNVPNCAVTVFSYEDGEYKVISECEIEDRKYV